MSNFIDFIKANQKIMLHIMLFLLVVAVTMLPELAFAKDLAAGAKTDVKDTFGQNSTFVSIILLLEILSAAWAYVLTKNLIVFGGVIGVMLFINVAFGLIAF